MTSPVTKEEQNAAKEMLLLTKKITEKDMEAADLLMDQSDSDDNEERGNWSGKLDFLLSCLSYAVGLGNLWRFPYLCYRNGGGAFLIPYAFMLVFAGIPLFFMELAFGQFASEGVITVWKICPLMKGIGWGMFMVSSFISIYYNVVIAWSLYYLYSSLTTVLPWQGCTNAWNTDYCYHGGKNPLFHCEGTVTENDTCILSNNTINYLYNHTMQNNSKSPSDEYFHNRVLGISEGFHEMGGIRWELAIALLFSWTLVASCLIKGIKSQGKVVYFTATFPYLVLVILLIRGLTLQGSMDGIMFYLTPQWHRLFTAKVWGDAAVQIFFSLSPCWGGLITLASYNKFHNNCLRDSLFVAVGNCLTSFFAGFVIFAIIGFMAFELGKDIDKVAAGGAGLAFVIYPEVVSRLPLSPIWAILFFSMLVTLGMGTQFSVVVTVHTTLLDVFPKLLRRGKRPMLTMVGICTVGYIFGLLCCTNGGFYLLQLIDTYAATYSVLIIGLCECCTITYIYGIDTFMKDIEMMLGYKPSNWWRYMWKVVTPSILVGITLFTWFDYSPSKYRDYTYPIWADSIGWVMSMSSVAIIPIIMVRQIYLCEHPGGIIKKIKFLAQPASDWGPALQKHKKIFFQNIETTIPLNVNSDSHVHSVKTEESTTQNTHSDYS